MTTLSPRCRGTLAAMFKLRTREYFQAGGEELGPVRVQLEGVRDDDTASRRLNAALTSPDTCPGPQGLRSSSSKPRRARRARSAASRSAGEMSSGSVCS
jgi:hypothetical protein